MPASIIVHASAHDKILGKKSVFFSPWERLKICRFLDRYYNYETGIIKFELNFKLYIINRTFLQFDWNYDCSDTVFISLFLSNFSLLYPAENTKKTFGFIITSGGIK